MSNSKLRLIPKDSTPRRALHLPQPKVEGPPSRASLIWMGIAAAAAPLLWIAHELLGHVHSN